MELLWANHGKSWQVILYVDRFAHKCLDQGCGKLQSQWVGNARMQEKINGSGNVCNMLQNIHRPKLPNLLLRELPFWYFLTSITTLCVCDTWNIFKLKPLHWCVKKRESKNHDQSWNESQPHANTSIQVLFIPETTLGPGDPWKGIVDDDERCIKGIYLSRF